jgi:Ser/Thr protein kinase RdoA (MazF antagonist)
MDNVVRVTSHLRRKAAANGHAKVLSIVEASDGSSCVRDADGEWWRLYDFIEGTHSVDKAATEGQAREAARAFGKFQAHLADLGGARLHETILNFHHTPSRVKALHTAVIDDPLARAAQVQAEIDFALSRERDAHRLLELLAAGHLTERVAHNDTKINNVMLDDVTGRAVAVVDLDTVMPGLALYDFGDLVRASASSTAEDDPKPANMHVILSLFRALVEGWLEAGAAPTAVEREHLPFAGKLIAYETGVRFLTDYLQGDVYFKVHHPEHNLHRARTQFALVKSIEEQAGAMAEIVAQVAARRGAVEPVLVK